MYLYLKYLNTSPFAVIGYLRVGVKTIVKIITDTLIVMVTTDQCGYKMYGYIKLYVDLYFICRFRF